MYTRNLSEWSHDHIFDEGTRGGRHGEAICSHRPYRPGLGIEAALGEITHARAARITIRKWWMRVWRCFVSSITASRADIK